MATPSWTSLIRSPRLSAAKVRLRGRGGGRRSRNDKQIHVSAPAKRARDRRDQTPKGPATRLMRSLLFDHDWYAEQTGSPRSRHDAARHYVRRGHLKGFSPHPLFSAHHLRSVSSEKLANDKPALLPYLRRSRVRRVSPHPLFDLDRYLAIYPAARRHPDGPLGHYLQFGAPSGARPNDWYRPDPVHEPRGLADWVAARSREWRARQQAAGPQWGHRKSPLAREFHAMHPRLRPIIDHKSDKPLVSIIVRSGLSGELLGQALTSIAEQSVNAWEVVVLDEGWLCDLEEIARTAVGGATLKIVPADPYGKAEAYNVGLVHCEGDFVAWMSPGELWNSDRLARLTALAQKEKTAGAYDGLARGGSEATRYCDGRVTPEHLRNGWELDLARLVVLRRVVENAQGFDDTLRGHSDFDFTLRLILQEELSWCPVLGVVRDVQKHYKATRIPPRLRPYPDHEYLNVWKDVSRNHHLIPWTDLSSREQVEGRVSVIIPTHADWRLTTAAVQSVCLDVKHSGQDVEVVVMNNGCDRETSVMIDALAERWGITVVHSPVNHGFALGNNLALAQATGQFIVFLNNDTEVARNWLTDLLHAINEPSTIGAQSLLVFPSGTVQSAGIAFPKTGGLPHEFLRQHPIEDAQRIGGLRFSALTAAALIMRFRDIVDLQGFDPVFRNGLEDVDLCLRARRRHSGGAFRVVPTSRVTHFESQSPDRHKKSIANRMVYIDRWAESAPRDDERLWQAVGFEVTGHRIVNVVAEDRRLCTPQPQIRRRIEHVEESTPALRWAIKNPAPAGAEGETWGDTYFARHLASALRRLGQQVVIDPKPEFYRPTGHLDDVVVALRGLTAFRPAFGQVNLGWVISHPEMLSWSEAASYDRLFAASVPWAAKMSSQWGIRIDPLLQATDPSQFHPDRARPDTGFAALFVGSSRMQLRPIVQQAIEAGLQLAIFGGGWSGLIPDKFVRGAFMSNADLGAQYRAAGLVLNDHWADMREQGFLSNRLFDAVASGGRVVTDDVTGLDNLFGRSAQVVTSTWEMSRIAGSNDLDAIFGEDDERRSVAERIAKEHSFDARAAQLLEAALELRKAKE
jgi:GT2 family glycosyltransferase